MRLHGRGVAVVVLACGLLGGCASAGASRSDGSSRLAELGFTQPVPFFTPSSTPAGTPSGEAPATALMDSDDHGFMHGVLLYIPNRIFDLLDIVRLRLRVGPGLAIGARATELADFFVGTYASVWIGIPGPRLAPVINWPFGLESNSGVEVSVADATTGAGIPPNYGIAEFGLGVQAVILGVDIGIDPWEACDFVTGILTIDLVDDDL